KDLAMHVAASDPRFASRSEVTPEMLATEKEIARAQASAAGKPANVVERIADGKVEKFYQETVLTEQAFVKEPERPSVRSSSSAAARKRSSSASFVSNWARSSDGPRMGKRRSASSRSQGSPHSSLTHESAAHLSARSPEALGGGVDGRPALRP